MASEVGAACSLSRRAFHGDSQRSLLSITALPGSRQSDCVGAVAQPTSGSPLILTYGFYSEYRREAGGHRWPFEQLVCELQSASGKT